MIRLLVLSLVVLLSFGSAMAGDINGRVIGVSDGDTISVLDAQHQVHKIRLAGIDAPEKAQPFGQRSKAGLSSTVFNREVEVVGSKRDRYGRIVQGPGGSVGVRRGGLSKNTRCRPGAGASRAGLVVPRVCP